MMDGPQSMAVRDGTRASYQERILQVLLYIQGHLDDPLQLETLAEHVRRLRLECAAHHPVRTRRTVTELAFEAGYETAEPFTRAFRSRFGVSPSLYRADETSLHDRPPLLSTDTGGERTMDIKVEHKDSRRVAFVRHIGPYIECGKAWETLCRWAGPRGLLAPQTTFLGLSYDDPEVTPAEKIRYDACITISDDTQPEGKIGVQEIPAGDFAIYLHKGPFEKLIGSYGVLCGGWLPESGREIKDQPSVEIYLNDPNLTPPEELLVEIQLPLE